MKGIDYARILDDKYIMCESYDISNEFTGNRSLITFITKLKAVSEIFHRGPVVTLI